MKLDIGCGHRPTGDVNVDLFIQPTPHRSNDQRKCNDKPLNVESIPNLIRADACHLPLMDNFFDEVFSSHTIEHVSNPYLMVKEMVRVARDNGIITIRCPCRFAAEKKQILHVSTFNLAWFQKAFEKCGLKSICLSYVRWRYFPHSYIPILRFPIEIQISASKSRLLAEPLFSV